VRLSKSPMEPPKSTSLEEGSLAWYAIYTHCRHEARAEAALHHNGVETYLPWITTPSRRRDRRRLLTVPLFPGYFFVHSNPEAAGFVEILKAPGVVRILGFKDGPAPVPETTIDSIRAIVSSNQPFYPWPPLSTGTRVRVLEGPLAGVVGVVQGRTRKRRLIVSVELFSRAVAVELDREALERWS
jgi:transcription termination/antitermination protein NusG